MQERAVTIEAKIPFSKIDWLIKLLFNACGSDGVSKIEIVDEDSPQFDGIVVTLNSDHVSAIANEAITYFELEQSVRRMIEE